MISKKTSQNLEIQRENGILWGFKFNSGNAKYPAFSLVSYFCLVYGNRLRVYMRE